MCDVARTPHPGAERPLTGQARGCLRVPRFDGNRRVGSANRCRSFHALFLYERLPVPRRKGLPWCQNLGSTLPTCGGQNREIANSINPKRSEKEKKLGLKQGHFLSNSRENAKCDKIGSGRARFSLIILLHFTLRAGLACGRHALVRVFGNVQACEARRDLQQRPGDEGRVLGGRVRHPDPAPRQRAFKRNAGRPMPYASGLDRSCPPRRAHCESGRAPPLVAAVCANVPGAARVNGDAN